MKRIILPASLLAASLLAACQNFPPASQSLRSTATQAASAGRNLEVVPARADGQRIALVVGNSRYRNVSPLANLAHDATLMAEVLRRSGFELIGGQAQLDLDKADFDRLIQQFGAHLGSNGVALFYYAGHGLQVDGENWLAPVNAAAAKKTDLDFQMVNMKLVLKQMEAGGGRLNLVILDACRNNPFPALKRGAEGGLAQMKAPEGTLIAYATQPDDVADDGTGDHSPYTAALASTLSRPGLALLDAFNQVGVQVKNATGCHQLPWTSNSPIEGVFYFNPGQPPEPRDDPRPDPAESQRQTEQRFWDDIKASTDPADFRAYLKQYPQGLHAELAQNRLARLDTPTPAPAPAPRPSPAPYTPPPPPACDYCPEMVRIPGGEFMMGSSSDETDERPRHRVRVGAFSLGKYEVTQGQWRR